MSYRLSVVPDRRPNPKRRLVPAGELPALAAQLGDWSARARYGGNPAHKKNPGDFGLRPPAAPREGKTLCDDAEVFTRAEAQQLLTDGIQRGLISVQRRNGWPQNVWAVAANGVELEAMLENPDLGTYHGYPLQAADPLRADVQLRWGRQ
ncbi:MAG: hypothetical protein JNK82_06330 [Myxococcaceae bacterium]|nr:hypothetical protein [Myxococcaceae bacterium]